MLFGLHKETPIVVGVVGTRVSEFMKRSRPSRVDMDSKGRPCLERQMTVLIDGPIMNPSKVEVLDWDRLQTEDCLNVSLEHYEGRTKCWLYEREDTMPRKTLVLHSS